MTETIESVQASVNIRPTTANRLNDNDHFNYPPAQKRDTMYLSTLKNEELNHKRLSIQKDCMSSLNTQDIDRAKPYYPSYKYTNKEYFMNRNDDIDGTIPKRTHQPLNKVYYGLKTDDIKGAQPQAVKFQTIRQPINPLVPEYKLPHFEPETPTPPKFIRDNIDIKDIDGSRPALYIKWNIDRKTLNVDDIEGARKKKTWIPSGKSDNLDVKDINHFLEFQTKRNTNPLSPRYIINDENNNKIIYGDIENKKLISHQEKINREISLDLKTSDIKGAQAGTCNEHYKKLQPRELFKNESIQGAKASTIKRGISTTRETNPLIPTYIIPGITEEPPSFTRNTQYIKKTMINNLIGSNPSKEITGIGITSPIATETGGVRGANTITTSTNAGPNANVGPNTSGGPNASAGPNTTSTQTQANNTQALGVKSQNNVNQAVLAPITTGNANQTRNINGVGTGIGISTGTGAIILDKSQAQGPKPSYERARSQISRPNSAQIKGGNMSNNNNNNNNNQLDKNTNQEWALRKNDYEPRISKGLSTVQKFDKFISQYVIMGFEIQKEMKIKGDEECKREIE